MKKIDKYIETVKRLLDCPNPKELNEQLAFSSWPDKVDVVFDCIEQLYRHIPLCEGTTQARRKCRRPIIEITAFAAHCLTQECQYSDYECAEAINYYREKKDFFRWGRKHFDDFESYPQGGFFEAYRKSPDRKPRPITENIIKRLKQEAVGRKDVKCRNCGKINNLNKIKDLSGKFNHNLLVEFVITHRYGPEHNYEIAELMGVGAHVISKHFHRLDELMPPNSWRSAPEPKSSRIVKPSGKPAIIPKAEEILQTDKQLEFAAKPPPRTKAQEKRGDEKRIEAKGNRQAAATFQKHVDQPTYEKTLRENEQGEKKIKAAGKDIDENEVPLDPRFEAELAEAMKKSPAKPDKWPKFKGS